jgi:hypothetical protein
MNLPEKGYYYHYKHTDKDISNYSYEVIGVAKDTEDGSFAVIYRPLYINDHIETADFYNRPLDMFMSTVNLNGRDIPRFTKILDPIIVYRLAEIKKTMYASSN